MGALMEGGVKREGEEWEIFFPSVLRLVVVNLERLFEVPINTLREGNLEIVGRSKNVLKPQRKHKSFTCLDRNTL